MTGRPATLTSCLGICRPTRLPTPPASKTATFLLSSGTGTPPGWYRDAVAVRGVQRDCHAGQAARPQAPCRDWYDRRQFDGAPTTRWLTPSCEQPEKESADQVKERMLATQDSGFR